MSSVNRVKLSLATASDHDVWVEHRKQRVEVALVRGNQEGVDSFSLAREIGIGNRVRGLHPAACVTGKLPCCRGRAANNMSDLPEGRIEHVVQHEHDSLWGSKRF